MQWLRVVLRPRIPAIRLLRASRCALGELGGTAKGTARLAEARKQVKFHDGRRVASTCSGALVVIGLFACGFPTRRLRGTQRRCRRSVAFPVSPRCVRSDSPP